MHKKQRTLRDRALMYRNQMEAENLFPVRYRTMQDALKNRNPLKFGDEGWAAAQFEQRFVPR